MPGALSSIVNLSALDQSELRKNVTNVLLQAILVELEKMGETLKCLQRQLETLKSEK